MNGLIGRKIGMTQIYDDDGNVVPVTVIEAGPCTIISLRTQDRDGYSALRLGFGGRKTKNVPRAIMNPIKAAGYTDQAPSLIREIRLSEDPSEQVGDQLDVTIFNVGDYVDVRGTSKGRGFQGVVRRHRFHGGRASHGGGWLRKPGAIGCKEEPGKVYKRRKMPGQMGNVRRTVQNLKIVGVLPDDHLLLVKGAVPGASGGHVVVFQSRKK